MEYVNTFKKLVVAHNLKDRIFKFVSSCFNSIQQYFILFSTKKKTILCFFFWRWTHVVISKA
jgi:hypothetical protein